MDGFVNLKKPIGMTSNDAVVKARGILKRALGERVKVGHLGTLDPLAEGVLPIAVGRATRLFDYAQKKRKLYVATFKFGVTTDTLDGGGAIVSTDDVVVSENMLRGAILKFFGEIEQVPPQYSAKSVGGRRAYDIAREGGHVDLPPKKVTVYSIELIDDIAYREQNEFKLKIECSSGTYIRALARDIAREMGTVGYMASLVRIKCGSFAIEDGVSFDDFEREPLKYVLPMSKLLDGYDVLSLDEGDAQKALNGVAIKCDKRLDSPFAVECDGKIVAMGELDNGYLRLRTRL